ncbi:hypothetical protein Slin14017_G014760 [Septoria linicola]|nr:hypothetical protein Slin14017_G014760 [Septoria linicola]
MPPKKKREQVAQQDRGNKDGASGQPNPGHDNKPDVSSKKRKANVDSEQPAKAARRSARGTAKPQPSQSQLLKYLLSRDAEEQCRPSDEAEDIQSRGQIKTYSSSALNPFEELLCALILSRPISHRLGLRSIRTLLNEPYSFNSAKAVQDAGDEKRTQALYDARTQHKDKTAAQLGQLAETVLEKFTADGDDQGTQLGRALKEHKDDVDGAVDELKKEVKGLGATGIEIFLRRVQWRYPYIDNKTQDALKQLALPSDADKLREAIEQDWSKLETKHLAGDDEAARKQRAFVIILERATAAQLEGKIETMLGAAASSA